MRHLRTLSILCLSLLVTGCFKTSLIGRGYSSYREPYKSEKGQSAPSIGYTYSAPYNEQVINDMRFAAKDLVSQLESGISDDVDKIYLIPGGQSAFYMALDHVLRDELTYRGFELATAPEHGALPVTIAAAESGKTDQKSSKASAYRELFLALVSGEKTLARGDYIVPAYGFTRSTVSAPDPVSVPQSQEDTSAPLSITEVTSEPLTDLPPVAPNTGSEIKTVP
ncbi:MAG: hypothetical protein KDI65_10155 [Alphaproteobacteria bacterium]|nr:hypothetical protein [Alphaproteobacteria bacterium]